MKYLADYLQPYMTIDPTSLSDATQGDGRYYYTSVPANGYQTYGFMVMLDGNGGNNDGGYFSNYYEVGQQPRYCMSQYTGTNANWMWSWDGSAGKRCYGGN